MDTVNWLSGHKHKIAHIIYMYTMCMYMYTIFPHYFTQQHATCKYMYYTRADNAGLLYSERGGPIRAHQSPYMERCCWHTPCSPGYGLAEKRDTQYQVRNKNEERLIATTNSTTHTAWPVTRWTLVNLHMYMYMYLIRKHDHNIYTVQMYMCSYMYTRTLTSNTHWYRKWVYNLYIHRIMHTHMYMYMYTCTVVALFMFLLHKWPYSKHCGHTNVVTCTHMYVCIVKAVAAILCPCLCIFTACTYLTVAQ